MSREIERKFLLKRLPSGWKKGGGRRIEQGYLVTDRAGNQARLRRLGRIYSLTVKRGGGLARDEFEIRLTGAQFRKLWPATAGRRLSKVRYEIPCKHLTIEIDIYEGRNKGLRVAEVEFATLRECRQFDPPTWVGRDVSGETRYSNIRLARE